MSNRKRPDAIVRGWIEILMRDSETGDVEGIEDYQPEDYEMHGGPIAACEFDDMWGVFDMYSSRVKADENRFLTDGDVINLVCRRENELDVITFGIAKKRDLVAWGIKNSRLEFIANSPYALVQLNPKRCFESFHARNINQQNDND